MTDTTIGTAELIAQAQRIMESSNQIIDEIAPKPAPSPGLREALVDILAHCDEANVVYAHQPNCTCDRCIIGRIARKALEVSDG